MRIVFSRKGFDASSGGAPSPIVKGVPISLPIPTSRRSLTTYELAGLGEVVSQATRGRLRPENLCHEDPMFFNDQCAFGQTGNAQSHLSKQGIGLGDIFLFFGLFAEQDGQDRHHRIFGFLQIEEVRKLGRFPQESDGPEGFPRRHPHTVGEWNENNTLYVGRGFKAKHAHESLRLTKAKGPTSRWIVPSWLREAGLSFHNNPARWIGENELQTVGRGQEFVSDIGLRAEPMAWLAGIIEIIET